MAGVLSAWDILLLIVVTLQATIHAYIADPQWKAFFYLLPFPFSAAALALNAAVDSTNLWSLLLLLSYSHCVRVLHHKLKLQIHFSIAISLVGCALLGFSLAPILEFLQSRYSLSIVFWLSCVGIVLLSLMIQRLMPVRDEPFQRTEAPLPTKLASIAAVVFCLILLKKQLGGFITAFPMVGVVAAYEARQSLWTMSRQVSVLLPALATMMVAVHWAQSTLGWSLPLAIGVGWIVYLPLIFLCTPILRKRILNHRERVECEAMPPAD